MVKRRPASDDFDSPWKDALERYLTPFLLFFFADIHADIDWSRGYASLDKEFQQILHRAKVGKRVADKLFKVWLKDGGQRWLLIHVEIQGGYESDFAQRMFEYNLAAWQLHRRTVVSLALLCDDRPEWRPTSFSHGEWGCTMELTFRIAKLLDNGNDLEALEASDNPMAAVVLAHLQSMRTRGDPTTRQQWKLRVVKSLYRHKWAKEDIRELFRLIDWIMALPEELDHSFRTEFQEFEEEQNMPYVTSIERLARKEGREEGRQEGREEGLLESIAMLLADKFGKAGQKLLPKVRALGSIEKLRRFNQHLIRAKSLDDVRAYLAD